MSGFSNFIGRLKKKFLLVAQNEDTFSQIWSIRTSRLAIFLFITFIISISAGISLFSYSKLTSNKGGVKVETEQSVIRNNSRIDSLKRVILIRDHFIRDVQKVLRGDKFADSNLHLNKPHELGDSIVFDFSKSIADSLLKAEIEQDNFENSSSSFDNNENLAGVFFFSPITGIVSQSFNKKTGHFGVDVVANKDETIKSALDGFVIYSGWSSNDGHVLIIDHRNGLITCYKHNSSLMKKTGEKVQAGDPIAIIGNSGEQTSGHHLHFELWDKGQAIDPQKYITFH